MNLFIVHINNCIIKTFATFNSALSYVIDHNDQYHSSGNYEIYVEEHYDDYERNSIKTLIWKNDILLIDVHRYY